MAEYGEVSWVRLPSALKERIQQIAEAEHRTLTAQIVVLLESIPQLQHQPAGEAESKQKKGAK